MQQLADAERVAGLIAAMGEWAGTLNRERSGNLAVVGVRRRGDLIARRVADAIGLDRVGTLDITLYRDDLSEATSQPVVRTTEVDFDLDGLDVILIDDVLMSGRSVRAALSSLMDLGRPRRIWLAVLVDRGADRRELPIAPDFAAETVSGDGRVQLQITPLDESDAIVREGGRD